MTSKPMTTSSNNLAIENCFERRDLCELIEPLLVYDENKNTAFILINVHHTRQISAHHGFDSATDMMHFLAAELKEYVKEDCKLIRTGNHEFALILQNLKNPGHCQLALNSIERNINNKTHSGKSYSTKTHITVSAALYPKHAITAESLIQSAEIAMYQATQNDLPQCMYTESMSNRIEHKLRIESELDAAIIGQLLEVWYQPKINLKDGTLYGVEALCRWQSQSEGYISPDIFIPIAEDSILIKELTHWVLNTALRTLKDWEKMGLKINCAVNISGRVIDDHEFISLIEHITGIWSVEPRYITLEVTETAMMRSFESNMDKLRTLKDHGYHISMDDFGTGYSSLEYFKNLPVDEVKIDKSFVINMMDNEADRKMVSMITGLSRGFGLKIVAEGVENEASLQALKSLGVHRAQGYHIAKPMPEKEFLTWAEFYLTNLKKNNHV
jgi:diguanylate cyclase (GGDEF)-like protein